MIDVEEEPEVHVYCVMCSALFDRDSSTWIGQAREDQIRCTDCIAHDRRTRWFTVVIDSREFTAEPVNERLHDLALAYLRASKVLCVELGDSGDVTWPRASVVAFNSRHAVELFLKACIGMRSEGEPLHHNVDQLQRRFGEIFPGIPPLCTRWDERIFDIPVDQHYRYSADRQGNAIAGVEVFAPGFWFEWIEEMEAQFERIWTAVRGST